MSYDVYWVKNRAEKIADFEHPTSKVNGFYMAGMYNEAVNSANEAKKWSTIGIITGLVIQVVYMAVYFFVLDAAID